MVKHVIIWKLNDRVANKEKLSKTLKLRWKV